MDPKKRFPGLIEHNKNSPLQILDVRSINENLPTTSYNFHNAEADESADESSGSEKELVIDMAGAEPEDPQEYEDKFFAQNLKLEKSQTVSEIEFAPPQITPQTVPKNRINRRKSQHIRLDSADVMYDAPDVPTAAPEPDPEPERDELQEAIDANRNIMQHIALLRTTINYLLHKHHQNVISFPVNGASDFETMDSWMEHYEQIKYDALPGTSQAKK